MRVRVVSVVVLVHVPSETVYDLVRGALHLLCGVGSGGADGLRLRPGDLGGEVQDLPGGIAVSLGGGPPARRGGPGGADGGGRRRFPGLRRHGGPEGLRPG